MGMWGVHILICLYLVRQCSPNLQTIAMYSRNQNLTLLALFAKIGINLEIFGLMVEPGGSKKLPRWKNLSNPNFSCQTTMENWGPKIQILVLNKNPNIVLPCYKKNTQFKQNLKIIWLHWPRQIQPTAIWLSKLVIYWYTFYLDLITRVKVYIRKLRNTSN